MQQIEILLVILFLSRKKLHAKQMFVLSSSMKLGPGGKHYYIQTQMQNEIKGWITLW